MKIKDLIEALGGVDEGLTFFGSPCTKDCSGHLAGWNWERRKNKGKRAGSWSNSFNNGTEIAATQTARGLRPIGPMIRGAKGRFQKFQPAPREPRGRIREEQELDELTGVKKYHDLTASELMVQVAEDYGLKILGSGALGTVIQTRNPDIVVKVFEDDDAYLQFLELTKSHPNEHFPKSRGLPRMMTAFYKRYNIQPNKFVVVELEKLYELDPSIAEFCSRMAGEHLDDVPPYTPGGLRNYDRLTYEQMSEDYYWIPSLMEAVDEVLSWGIGETDMHAGNFMQRKDGTIIINDPVYDENSSSFPVKSNKWHDVPYDIKGPHYRTQAVDEDQLDELTGVKKYHDLSALQVMGLLANNFGMKILGMGAYGYVLSSSDPNYVYKVIDNDPAYLSFINFVSQHPNDHYPHIKKVKNLHAFYRRAEIDPDQFTVIVIEKLQEMSPSRSDFAVQLCEAPNLNYAPYSLPNGQDNGDSNADEDDYDVEPQYTFRELSGNYPWIPSLWNAWQDIFKSGMVMGHPDPSMNNFMQRADGTIVIIDPVSEPDNLSIQRQRWKSTDSDRIVKGPTYKKKGA